jgi:ribosome maturation factor RimP
MGNLSEEIRSLIEEKIEDLGYKIKKIEIGRERGIRSVTVYIFKEDEPIGIKDCVKVSKVIDPILEKADIIKEKWILIVSSPGDDEKR